MTAVDPAKTGLDGAALAAAEAERRRKTGLRLAVVIAGVCFGLDQLSKFWILHAVDIARTGPLHPLPILNLVFVRNTGVNFGLFASDSQLQQQAMAALAAAVSVVLAIWAARSSSRWIHVGCGLVIGGALGNAVDRLVHGAVIDFLNVDCCGIGNPYAFNIADTTIFLGAIILAAASWRDDKPESETTSPG